MQRNESYREDLEQNAFSYMPVSSLNNVKGNKLPSRDLSSFAEPGKEYLMVYKGGGIFQHRKGVSSITSEGLWAARTEGAGATAGHRRREQQPAGLHTSGGKSLPFPRVPGEAGADALLTPVITHRLPLQWVSPPQPSTVLIPSQHLSSTTCDDSLLLRSLQHSRVKSLPRREDPWKVSAWQWPWSLVQSWLKVSWLGRWERWSDRTVRGCSLTETAHPGRAPQWPFAWRVLWQEVLVRNTKLISLHQPEEFRKRQKEIPQVRPPPRILLAGIRLGWTRRAPPGRTLSQNDQLKATRKLIPSP